MTIFIKCKCSLKLRFLHRLPREVKPNMFIGIACLPQRFQQLPKSRQCTVIGWGKQKSQDVLGTAVLHEAEVSADAIM